MKIIISIGIVALMVLVVATAQQSSWGYTYNQEEDTYIRTDTGQEFTKEGGFYVHQQGIVTMLFDPVTGRIEGYSQNKEPLYVSQLNSDGSVSFTRTPDDDGFGDLLSTYSAPTYVGFEDKFPEGSTFETVGGWFDIKTSDDKTYRVGRVYEQNIVKGNEVVGTGFHIKDNNGNNIAGVNEKGEYLVWDSKTNEWGKVTSSQYEVAIREAYTNQLVAQGVDRPEAERLAAAEAERTAKETEAQKASMGLGAGFTGTIWQSIGLVMKAYEENQGIGKFVLLAWPEYGEWSREWRRTISQSFCGFVSIQNCFESLICGAILDINAGDSISGNVLFGRGPNGQPLTAGTINAQRSLPIILKGLERERLKEIIGEKIELVVINGNVINISEVDTTMLPATELRLYRIQYSLTNVNDREMKYNLEFKGQTTRKFFSSDKKLSPGQTVPSDDRNIEVYSATKYDEVCMTFNPSLPSGGASTGSLMVAPKLVNKLCKPIVEYVGGATSIGNYAKKADEEKKQGAPSGGFI
jgi:hypothetical protein